MFKNHKLIFAQLTFLLISLAGYYFAQEKPFYFFNQDAEVDYFINSLLVSLGKETWSFHHPGIFIQYLGGYVLSLFYNSDPFQAKSFLLVMKWILVFCNLLLIILAFKIRGNLSKETIFTLALLSFAWPSFLYYLDYFTVDSIVQSLSIVLFLAVWKNLLEEKFFIKDRLILSGLMSFVLSLKISFAPFVAISIFSILIKDVVQHDYSRGIFRFNLILLPASFVMFLLFFNLPIIERFPYLVMNTLFEIFSMLYNKKLLMVIVGLALITSCLGVLSYFKYIKIPFLSLDIQLLPKYIFLFSGSCIFILNILKVDYSNFYHLGMDLRNASAYLVFFLFLIISFLNQRKFLAKWSLLFSLSIFLSAVITFTYSRDIWISQSLEQEKFLKELTINKIDQNKTVLVWTGSGNNNFLIENFYMWGNYRYSNEQFSDLFASHFKNIRLIRLRSLRKNNQYYIHNNSSNLIEKLSGYKIFFPERTNFYDGGLVDSDNVVVVILKGEIINEMKFQDSPPSQFKFFIEDSFDRKFTFSEIEHKDFSYFVFE